MIQDHFLDYLLELQVSRDAKTVAKHEHLLRHFLRYLESQSAQTINRRVWLNYLVHLKQSDYSPWTIHTTAQVVRRFLDWLADEGVLDSRLTKPSDIPKPPLPKPNPMTETEVNRILRYLDQQSDWLSKRDFAFVLCLLDTGLRLSELLQFTVSQTLEGVLLVRQKGGRYLQTYLTDDSKRAVRRYLRAYQLATRHRLLPTDAVWRDRTREPLTANGVKKRFQHLSRRLGFRIHAHRFRATSITWRLEAGASTELVREAVGHRDERSIRHYAKLAETKKRELLRETSPLKRIR